MIRSRKVLSIIVLALFLLVQFSGVIEARDYNPSMDDNWKSDITPPSVPQNLYFISVTENTATFEWDTATDDVAVFAYVIFVNGVRTAVTRDNYFTHDLDGLTKCTYQVAALDFASNESELGYFLVLTEEMTQNAALEELNYYPPNKENPFNSTNLNTVVENNSIYDGYPVEIDSMSDHNILLTNRGNIFTWGRNDYGQLGNGDEIDSSSPTKNTAVSNIIDIATGCEHSLAVDSSGDVWTWGNNTDGQLGDGTTSSKSTPVKITGVNSVTKIDAGKYHTVALKSDGTVWCWGDNSEGQLGDGTTTDRTSPTQISGLTGITNIFAGYYYNFVIKSDGTIWSWGANDSGQLGDGTTTDKTSPVQITGLSNIESISTGANHTFLVKTDGTVYACGENGYYQLGDGTTTDRTSPTQISSLSGVMSVFAGENRSYVIENDMSLLAWGENSNGQLGNGSETNETSPDVITGVSDIAFISSGKDHTVVIRNNGEIWTWGLNDYGQLADGNALSSDIPLIISSLSNIRMIEAGESFNSVGEYPGNFYKYNHKVELSIDYTKIGSGLVNFPITVFLDSTNFDFSDSYATGYDVIFTDLDNNLLSFERELHDKINEEGVYHVKVPVVSPDSVTKFYMYYGNEDALDLSDPENVWDDYYELVCHMSGILTDSTKNDVSMEDASYQDIYTAYSSNSYGTYRTFNGYRQKIRADVPFENIEGDFTAEVVFKADNYNVREVLLYQGIYTANGYGGDDEWHIGLDTTNLLNAAIYADVSGYDIEVENPFTDTSNLHHVVMLASDYDGASTPTVSQILDGGTKVTVAGTGILSTANISDTLYIGSPGSYYDRVLNGQIHEVRVSNINRSDSWVNATYDSIFDNLLSFSNIQSETGFSITENATIDSYPESNHESVYTSLVTDIIAGQSFSTGNQGFYVTEAVFYLDKDGYFTDDYIQAEIFEATGIFGTDSTVQGSPIAFSEMIECSAISASYSLESFTFGNSVYLSPNSEYIIALKIIGYTGSSSNKIKFAYDLSSPSHNGNLTKSSDGGETWSTWSDYDYIFYVKGEKFGDPVFDSSGSTLNTLSFDNTYEIKLDNSKINSNLTDFPVRVLLDNTNFNFQKSYTNGSDIVFINSNDELLDFEKTVYDCVNSVAEFYVKIPSVSSTIDTNIYMLTGNYSLLYSLESPDDVWDDDYSFVMHLGSSNIDSTDNVNTVTVNETVSNHNGLVSRFDGVDDYIEISPNSAINSAEGTISVVLKPEDITESRVIIAAGETGSDGTVIGDSQVFITTQADGNSYAGWSDGGNDYDAIESSGVISTTTNSHLALTWDTSANSVKLYNGGTLINSTVFTNNNKTGWIDKISIGKAVNEASSIFYGEIDEIRISEVARSEAWIKAESSNFINQDLISITPINNFIKNEVPYKIYTWGDNEYGQLGDGTIIGKATPIEISNMESVLQTANGSDHMLALKQDGTVWAWGNNYEGQIGNMAVTTYTNSPVQTSVITDICWIAAGNNYSLAVENDGTVWAWGNNSEGQLGLGSLVDKTTAVEISSLSGVVAVETGEAHTLFLKSDGTVWAAGDNQYGQLGDGTTTDRSTPVQVSGLSNITSIATGKYHSVALEVDGTVWAWGYNSNGQIGDNSTSNRSSAVEITTLSNIVYISSGGYHTLAVEFDGSAWSWGANDKGQLGDSTYSDKHIPTQLQDISGVSKVSGGEYHSILIDNSGSVYCFGDNLYQQIGINRTLKTNVPVISSIEFSGIIREVNNLSIAIKVNDISSFSEKTFTITYNENILVADDLCGMTWIKETTTGFVPKAEITISSFTEGSIVFTISKTIPANTTWSGTINIIHFRKLHDGDPDLALNMS